MMMRNWIFERHNLSHNSSRHENYYGFMKSDLLVKALVTFSIFQGVRPNRLLPQSRRLSELYNQRATATATATADPPTYNTPMTVCHQLFVCSCT